MAIEIMNFPIKHGGSFHSYVSLPEGTPKWFFFVDGEVAARLRRQAEVPRVVNILS